MNRQQRRRADRALRRLGRRGRVETTAGAGIVATCGHNCGRPGSVITAGDINEASDKLRAHYASDHDGNEP